MLELLTNQPGLQVYSGNFLDGSTAGKGGRLYRQSDAVCLEPHVWPDTPNRPDFPTARLAPGRGLSRTTLSIASRCGWHRRDDVAEASDDAMEEVPTSVLCDERCHLGEGPTYDAATDTAWWFDILERRLFEAQLGSGQRPHPFARP